MEDDNQNRIKIAFELPETVDLMCRRLCRRLKYVDHAFESKKPEVSI